MAMAAAVGEGADLAGVPPPVPARRSRKQRSRAHVASREERQWSPPSASPTAATSPVLGCYAAHPSLSAAGAAALSPDSGPSSAHHRGRYAPLVSASDFSSVLHAALVNEAAQLFASAAHPSLALAGGGLPVGYPQQEQQLPQQQPQEQRVSPPSRRVSSLSSRAAPFTSLLLQQEAQQCKQRPTEPPAQSPPSPAVSAATAPMGAADGVADVSRPRPSAYHERTASIFKAPHVSTAASPSSSAVPLCPSPLSPLCSSPVHVRLFASPIRRFARLSVSEANLLLQAKQEKAARLREDGARAQQEKLREQAARGERVEQRLMQRLVQRHEAVEGRLTAAAVSHDERVEQKRRRATTENQKVAEVAFINALTGSMSEQQRLAALEKRLSRTALRRKERQAERLHVVTAQAEKHRAMREKRAQVQEGKENSIRAIQHKLEEAHRRRQERRQQPPHASPHPAQAAVASAPRDGDDGADEAAQGEDGVAWLSPGTDSPFADDSGGGCPFSAIDLMKAPRRRRSPRGEAAAAAEPADGRAESKGGRTPQRRPTRPQSSPAPSEHRPTLAFSVQPRAARRDAARPQRPTYPATRAQSPTRRWPSAALLDASRSSSLTLAQLRGIRDADVERMDAEHSVGSADGSPPDGRQSPAAAAPALFLCADCGALLASADYARLHATASPHQREAQLTGGQRPSTLFTRRMDAAALLSASTGGSSTPSSPPRAVECSWWSLGRWLSSAPSLSSRRNAKRRARRFAQRRQRTGMGGALLPDARSGTTETDAEGWPNTVRSLLAQLHSDKERKEEEEEEGKDAEAKEDDDWAASLLLRMEAAGRALSDGELGQEGTHSSKSLWPSSVFRPLAAAVLSRCLLRALPSAVHTAGCALLSACWNAPRARPALEALLFGEAQLLPLVQALQRRITEQLSAPHRAERSAIAAMLDLVSLALSTPCAAPHPDDDESAVAARIDVLAFLSVSGLLHRSAQLLLSALPYVEAQLSHAVHAEQRPHVRRQKEDASDPLSGPGALAAAVVRLVRAALTDAQRLGHRGGELHSALEATAAGGALPLLCVLSDWLVHQCTPRAVWRLARDCAECVAALTSLSPGCLTPFVSLLHRASMAALPSAASRSAALEDAAPLVRALLGALGRALPLADEGEQHWLDCVAGEDGRDRGQCDTLRRCALSSCTALQPLEEAEADDGAADALLQRCSSSQ